MRSAILYITPPADLRAMSRLSDIVRRIPDRRPGEAHGGPLACVPLPVLRAGFNPGQAVLRHGKLIRSQVQPPGPGWLAREAAVRLGVDRKGRRASVDAEGLSVRARQIRRVHRGR